jgi:hypothetical protein
VAIDGCDTLSIVTVLGGGLIFEIATIKLKETQCRLQQSSNDFVAS